MAKVCPLYSGSSGNSTFIGCQSTGILVDAGVNCKKILQGLEAVGQRPEDIKAIFITHEHSDHVAGLKVLLKRCPVPVYGSMQTLEYLIYHDLLPQGAKVEAMEEDGVAVEDMLFVRSFDTPHDSVHSVGYRVSTADGKELGFATDMGCYTDTVRENLLGCDLVLLESNYEPSMLRCSRYPYHLIRRIASDTGHLSNEDCAQAAAELAEQGTSRIMLAHLSRENNAPPLARQATLEALSARGLTEGVDYILQVAQRESPDLPILL